MKMLLSCETSIGTFYIAQTQDGRFHPVYDGDSLGSYAELWQAVEDLTIDATCSILHPVTSELVDTSTLGIPEDWQEWDRLT
jgi:hypothetical protein